MVPYFSLYLCSYFFPTFFLSSTHTNKHVLVSALSLFLSRPPEPVYSTVNKLCDRAPSPRHYSPVEFDKSPMHSVPFPHYHVGVLPDSDITRYWSLNALHASDSCLHATVSSCPLPAPPTTCPTACSDHNSLHHCMLRPTNHPCVSDSFSAFGIVLCTDINKKNLKILFTNPHCPVNADK